MESPEAFERWRNGDGSAFAEIVQEHQRMVYSMACHALQNRALAAELAQDVFLELHRNRRKIESAGHLKLWLRKVTARRLIDCARKRREANELAGEPAAIPDPGDPLLRGLLQRLVATLPEPGRTMVILRYQEDLDPSEIAGILDTPLLTVKSTLHRSIALLRAKLEAMAGKGVGR
ncbi:MAG: sigma-70 family RNA polymerase sigma factor [Acidobacteria bacterium]|nr:sigma-70 family RNA polymerase sigma factor [Acidobacteriota bacterium]